MNQPLWKLLNSVKLYSGYVHGSRFPSLLVSFHGQALHKTDCGRLLSCFKISCPALSLVPVVDQGEQNFKQSVEWLLTAWQALQSALGLPVSEVGQILSLSANQARCLVPSLEKRQLALANVIKHTLAFLSVPMEASAQTQSASLTDAIQQLGLLSMQGANMPRFVNAAFQLGLPFHELPGGVYQFGEAKCARWMDSTFTDETPTISAKLARNKVWTAALLRQAGLPVQPHQLVNDAEMAVKLAVQLKYPVVVKPADLDGGAGVAAGLESEAEVRHAYAHAKTKSKNILVEKHFEGRDYRITVFNDEMIWATERVPAGVTGDGLSTVFQLIEQVNADPRRGEGPHSPLKRLTLDEEVLRLLERQNLTKDSVPKSGQWVRLNRIANVAVGGMPVAVFDRVHPDNARLAIRAAQALRLDLAGIDLLIPDISISWRQSGAAICEVNGQPSLGFTTAAHLYAPILKRLVSGSGRVPTVLILGAREPQIWVNAILRAFSERGLKCASVSPEGVTVGGEVLTTEHVSTFAGTKMLLLNRDVEAMVIAVNDLEMARATGLPVARFDMLVLAGHHIQAAPSDDNTWQEHWRLELLRSLLPACEGTVVTYTHGGVRADALRSSTAANWVNIGGDVTGAIRETIRLITEKIG